MAVANVENLATYRLSDDDGTSAFIGNYVCRAVDSLPYQYRLPMQSLALALGIICWLTTARSLESLRPATRQRTMRLFRLVPLERVLAKYVRAMALLALFDSPRVTTPPAEARPGQ